MIIVVHVITAFTWSYLMEFHCDLGQWGQNCNIMKKLACEIPQAIRGLEGDMLVMVQ